MYHYLYGVDGISVYAYDTKESLLKAFAGVYAAITEGDAPEGVDVEHFNEVRQWSQKEAVKNSSWILFAFKRYFDFLEWRKSKSVDHELGCADPLRAALLLFQRERGQKSASDAQDLEAGFKTWCVDKDGKAKTTADTYATPLRNVTRPMIEAGKSSTWTGIYEFIFGKKPEKGVFDIATPDELSAIYGDLLKVYAAEDLPMPGGAIPQNWNKVRAWVKADRAKGKDGQVLDLPAFHKYEAFLKWRTENGANEGGPDGWASYDAWAEAVRAEFARVDAGMFSAEGFDYAGFMRKFVYSVTVANTLFANHTADERDAVGNFISQERVTPHAVSWYLDPGNRPTANGEPVPGMGTGVMLNFMMKVRPAEFATYSKMIDEMLVFTGLAKTVFPKDPMVESYEASKALQGQVLAKMHELKIGQTAESATPADYLTVNEFAWWLSDEKNRNSIKEKIMCMQLKKDKPTMLPDDENRKKLTFKANDKDDELLLRLLASLRAKPFAILAGHSGTGKSRYVKKLAYMTCNANELRVPGQLPGNYLMLQVKPNWHDSTDLLGFRNAMADGKYQKTALIEFLFRAYHYSTTPFFLCLDEMNLAPVEQYFAEFLSAMESEEPVPLNDITEDEGNLVELGCEWEDARDYVKAKHFSIPDNLFIVGTVNMDETTNQFSRKVLDRAFTIEMTDVDFRTFDGSHDKYPSYEDTIEEAKIQELMKGAFAADKLDDDDREKDSALIKVQQALAATPFAIAYRFASEYTLLKRAIKSFDAENVVGLDALDQSVLMKILPRIAGDADYIKKVYGEKEDEGLRGALVGKTVSLAKIEEILKRAKETGAQYITFWP